MRRPHLLPDYSVYDILSLGRADLEARAAADKAYREAVAQARRAYKEARAKQK